MFSTAQLNPLCKSLPVKFLSRNYAFKSDLKIKWVRPEKIPCYKPEKSGDLKPKPAIDQNQFLLAFQESKELQTADETVKKLFSLKYAPERFTTEVYRHGMMDKVRRHDYDSDSVEVKLARVTGIIRALQETFERFPRNKRVKVQLKELIDRRKKQLKFLRRRDYKKFEWLLESLDIVFKPHPERYHWITRKESLQKLTTKYCDGIRQERLDKFRFQLTNLQPSFLEEKIRSLQFIRDEQRECGVEVTVTQEEIDEIKRQLEELRRKQSEENSAND